jgi:hypothetical protein
MKRKLAPTFQAPTGGSIFVDRVESLISSEGTIWVNAHQQKVEPVNNQKASPSFAP